MPKGVKILFCAINNVTIAPYRLASGQVAIIFLWSGRHHLPLVRSPSSSPAIALHVTPSVHEK